MASGLSTAERNRFLDARFATLDVWGALCDGDPSDAGDMSGQEIAASFDYARTELTCLTAAAGSISNTAALEFPVANGGSWGTIGWLAICTTDTEAADDSIASGSLTASKTIADGDQIKFAIGNITIAIAAQA